MRKHVPLVGYLFLAVAVAVSLYRVDVQSRRGEEARVALCAFKIDLEKREDSSRRFLSELQSGKREPIPGISEADIKQSLRNQRSTLRTLRSLDCD